MPGNGWDALSADAKPKLIKSQKEGSLDKSDKSVPSAKTENTNKSLLKTTKLKKLVSALQKSNENGDDASSTLSIEEEGSSHFQNALGRHN